jgi:hypothetical protein
LRKTQTKTRLQSDHEENGRKRKSSIGNAAPKENTELASDAEAAFWKIYAKVENKNLLRKRNGTNENFVCAHELINMLVTNNISCPDHAEMMLEKIVSKGKLKKIYYDIYVRSCYDHCK